MGAGGGVHVENGGLTGVLSSCGAGGTGKIVNGSFGGFEAEFCDSLSAMIAIRSCDGCVYG